MAAKKRAGIVPTMARFASSGRYPTAFFVFMVLAAGISLPRYDLFGAERIVIGTPSRGLFEFPVVVAIRKGYFKDEGFDTDKVQMQPAIAVKALISGDIDYLMAWGSEVRVALSGGALQEGGGLGV